MSAEAFDCVGYLANDFARALAHLGASTPMVLQVVVPGRPECRAHYRLGEGKLIASSGLAEWADVTLSIQPPELEQLARGQLDLEEAMMLERLRFFGNREKLDQLSAALRHTWAKREER
jgi:alkyl sulfatase BDS1-like metallo-beta-lactamase superfamily hydrolase